MGFRRLSRLVPPPICSETRRSRPPLHLARTQVQPHWVGLWLPNLQVEPRPLRRRPCLVPPSKPKTRCRLHYLDQRPAPLLGGFRFRIRPNRPSKRLLPDLPCLLLPRPKQSLLLRRPIPPTLRLLDPDLPPQPPLILYSRVLCQHPLCCRPPHQLPLRSQRQPRHQPLFQQLPDSPFFRWGQPPRPVNYLPNQRPTKSQPPPLTRY